MENSVSANSISKPLYLRVSLVALGTGNFGTACGYGADPDTAELIFNAYDEAGGNFIDTADVYQFGQSEELLGKFLQGRRKSQLSSLTAMPLMLGRSRVIGIKLMIASVETSLKCFSSIDLNILLRDTTACIITTGIYTTDSYIIARHLNFTCCTKSGFSGLLVETLVAHLLFI